jgi:hypothetical protein
MANYDDNEDWKESGISVKKKNEDAKYFFYMVLAFIIFTIGYWVVSLLKTLILLIFPFSTYLLLTLLIKFI